MIVTALERFELDDEAASDLLAHIRTSAGDQRSATEEPLVAAIDNPAAPEVRWNEDGKHGALRAIDAWLIAAGPADMPAGIDDLRYELMRDLNLPPFDEDQPIEDLP